MTECRKSGTVSLSPPETSIIFICSRPSSATLRKTAFTIREPVVTLLLHFLDKTVHQDPGCKGPQLENAGRADTQGITGRLGEPDGDVLRNLP